MFVVDKYTSLLIPYRNGTNKLTVLKTETKKRLFDAIFPENLRKRNPSYSEIDEFNFKLWCLARNQEEIIQIRSFATLLLRCYVSSCLFESIHYIVKKYSNIKPKEISIESVSAVLLTDLDTKHNIYLEDNNILYFTANKKIEPDKSQHYPLSFEILKTWKPTESNSMSLRSWVRRKSMNGTILKFFGLCTSTPWYILARAPRWKLNYLSLFEQDCVEVFREIYLDELRNTRHNKYQRFPTPTQEQCSKMYTILESRGYSSGQKILSILVDIAHQLRTINKPLKSIELKTVSSLDIELEKQIHDTINNIGGYENIMKKAVMESLKQHFNNLKSCRRGQRKSENFIKIGYLFYCQNLSQQEIASKLHLSQSTTSRVLQAKNCIDTSLVLCIDIALKAIFSDPFFNADSDEAILIKKYLAIEFLEDFNIARKELFSASKLSYCSVYNATASLWFEKMMKD